MIIGVSSLLLIQIGWVGFVGILIFVLITPLNNFISSKNGEMVK